MVNINRFAALFCAVILAFSLGASAQAVNIDKWNTDSTLYEILNGDGKSNCDAERIFLRVKYDRPSNRIKLLFMLEFSAFEDELNAGVTLDINGGEKITLHADGSSEYNEDKYYIETDINSDPRSKTLLLEVTLGIKQGLPDTVKLYFNIYDTQGVASNSYCVDITEVQETITSQTSGEKTQKKPTKSSSKKTNKVKTTDSEATHTSLSEKSTTLTNVHKNDVVHVSERKIIICVLAGIVAAMIIMPGITRHIQSKKNPRDGG